MTTARQVIINVMAEVQAVAKKEKNAAQGFNFRGIDAVVNAVGPAFRKAGGFIVPAVINKTTNLLPTRNGGSMNAVALEVEFSIYGDEGEPVRGTVAAEAFDSGDKATAKAMSVALRTFLLQTLLLPTDDPDPDSQSYEIGATQVAKVKPLTELQLKELALKVRAASDKAELREIWSANALHLEQTWEDDFGATVSLKAYIMSRLDEVKA